MTYRLCSTIGNRRSGANRRPSDRPAFSLIEMLVAVSLFTVIILSSTGIFKMVIDSQRSALATQNVQESLKFFLEVTGKEIRMAQKNLGICPGIAADAVYVIGTENGRDTLSFKNYYGECVKYSAAADGSVHRFRVTRDGNIGFISPAKITIDRLDFIVTGDSLNQPKVTINLQAHAIGTEQSRSEMVLQTTVTSRYYK